MEKYLVVRCKELNDQYECDADRTPEVITEDWVEYCLLHENNNYEVWEIQTDGSLILIKEYYD